MKYFLCRYEVTHLYDFNPGAVEYIAYALISSLTLFTVGVVFYIAMYRRMYRRF